MKRPLGLILLVSSIILGSGLSFATPYVFRPTPVDLKDLPHDNYFLWGMNWAPPAGEEITSAVLTISNIYDWQTEPNLLSIYLLDGLVPIGTYTYSDSSSLTKPAWNTTFPTNTLVAKWTDTVGGPGSVHHNLSYDFSSLGLLDELQAYSANGRWGFGIDPDCHYYNDGFTFKVETRKVSEPSSFLLLGMGLTGLVFFRRKSGMI